MAGSRWYVVQTKPRKDQVVLAHLANQGIPYYRPLLRAPGRKSQRIVPLFPSYVFARMRGVPESVAVRYTPGVRRILGYGDRPYPVDDEFVDLLRSRESEGGLIRPSHNFRFHEGESVRIWAGPFRAMEALFRRYLPARDRVRVLLTFLGRQVEAEVAVDEIVPPSVL